MPPKNKPGGKSFPPKVKQSAFPPKTPTCLTTSSSSSSSNALDPEAEDQFETELCWCVQQLQIALDSGKLNEKQILDTRKTLNVLKNNNAPLIKKRQFMRTTFGDYRTKMNNDTKKLAKITTQVKFNPNSNESSKKSIFLRKKSENVMKKNEQDNPDNLFTFNFKQPSGDCNVDEKCTKYE